MLDALAALRKATKTAPPSEFYALLLMDGDRIGAQLRDDANKVKQGLADFTGQVVEFFTRSNEALGALVYAGGTTCWRCCRWIRPIGAAYELRARYGAAFGNDPAFTMSAAIVFAHYKVPLRRVVAEVHRQLDDIAKEANGRDSLALAALNPGGVACEWVSCWQGMDGGETVCPGRLLLEMARDMRHDPEFSTGFFHTLRDRYARLFDDPAAGDEARVFSPGFGDPHLMAALVRAEYARGGVKGKDAGAAVARLMRISQPLTRRTGAMQQAGRFSFDAVLMVRFLSQQIREGAP